MMIDAYGLPISQGDGGDSLHHYFTAQLRLALIKDPVDRITAWAITGIQSLAPVSKAWSELEISPGIWIRNPDPSKWYSDPRNTSRDQLTAPLAFYAFRGNELSRLILRRLLWACLKRGMFAQNIYPNYVDPRTQPVKWKVPDFMTPDLWTLWTRGLLGWLSWPVNLFLDVSILLAGVIKLVTLKPGDTDDDNMHNVLMVAQYRYPTPLSWLARKVFKRYRPQPVNTLSVPGESAMMNALLWYYRASIGGNVEFAEIARSILERY